MKTYNNAGLKTSPISLDYSTAIYLQSTGKTVKTVDTYSFFQVSSFQTPGKGKRVK